MIGRKPDPSSSKNILATLVTDYIPKRRGELGLFSFEYNLLPKLLTDFYYYMDQPLSSLYYELTKKAQFKKTNCLNIYRKILSIQVSSKIKPTSSVIAS